MKNTDKHDYHSLRVVLGWIVAVLAAFAIFMSWGALMELAVAYSIPSWRAWAFPLIIDLPAIGALIIARIVNDSSGWRRAYPWVVFGIFSAATIAGNAEVVSRIPADELPGPLWIAILVHSAPSIAALFTAHLALETVFRKDRWTAKASRTASTSPASTETRPAAVRREPSPKSTRTPNEDRALVERLVDEGLTAPEILLRNPGLARSSVYKWVALREAENAERDVVVAATDRRLA